jgi:hypothetical protein
MTTAKCGQNRITSHNGPDNILVLAALRRIAANMRWVGTNGVGAPVARLNQASQDRLAGEPRCPVSPVLAALSPQIHARPQTFRKRYRATPIREPVHLVTAACERQPDPSR